MSGGPRGGASMRATMVITALALALAGCVSPIERASTVGAPLALPSFGAPVAVSKDAPGGEPVIAVASDGATYVQGVGRVVGPPSMNVNKVWRSLDAGRSWTDVTPPGVGEKQSNDGFVAVGNGNVVYAVNVAELTFQLFASTDKGASWTRLPTPPVPALMHRNWVLPTGARTIHVAMEALPPSYAPALAGGPELPASTPNEGLWYMRSDDLGQSWTTPAQIDPIVNFAGQSNMVASKDGKFLAVARYQEDGSAGTHAYLKGKFYLISSEDAGATWKREDLTPLTSEMASAATNLALDDAGTLYFLWSMEQGGDSLVHLVYSQDKGKSWSAPRVLAPASAGRAWTQAMPWSKARAPGELGALWYAADAHGTASKVNASWFVDAATVRGADTPTPQVTIVRVTPDEIHHGNVCARGPACRAGEDRRLLDYPWIDFAPDGAAALVWASTKWTSPGAFAMSARELPRSAAS